jgi:hypothetical protein
LLILELGVRIFIPQDKKITWIEMHDSGFIMNQSGGSTFHEFDDIKINYQFTSNRTRGNFTENFDTSVVNILAIGDSFTFGLLLEEEDTYLSHLQNWADSSLSANFKFHNAAVGGAGIADWPLWLESYGDSIKPDKVLYFINNQDVIRGLSKNLFILTDSTEYRLIQSQRWKPHSLSINLPTKNWYRSLQAHSELANVIVKLLWRNVFFDDLTSQFSIDESTVPIPEYHQFNITSNYSLDLSIALLERMNNWCIDNKCDLIITNTGFFDIDQTDPHSYRLHEYLKDSPYYDYYDIFPCVSNSVESDFLSIQIPNDSHPNEIGSRIIFECIIANLPANLFSN